MAKANHSIINAPLSGGRQEGKALRGHLPVKRSINLAKVDEKKLSIPKAIFGSLIIILLAAAFSKFLVMDRLTAMNGASSLAAQKSMDLAKAMDLLASYAGVEDEYAHYTTTGMLQEEVSLVDRSRILRLVRKALPTNGGTTSWSVTGNIMTVEVTGDSLQKLNRLAKKLEKYAIVDSCTITNANKEDITKSKDASKEVRARLLVYLQQPPKEEDTK